MGEGYNLLGNLYLRFEKYSQAAHVLKNGIDNVPNFANNYHDLGLVYRAQERYESAIKQFSKARMLKPSHLGALFNLGMTYAEAGQRVRALKHLEMYVARRSTSEDGLRGRAAERMIAKLKDDAARVK